MVIVNSEKLAVYNYEVIMDNEAVISYLKINGGDEGDGDDDDDDDGGDVAPAAWFNLED